MNLSILRLSKLSFVCSLSIIVTALTLYYLFTNYFLPFNSTWSFTVILITDGFINGIIFGKNINKSTAQLLVFFEILFLIYFTIIFTLNPWGNATHIPFSLFNIPLLLIIIGTFSTLGLFFLSLLSLNIVVSGSWGDSLKNWLTIHTPQKEVLQ